MGKVLYWDVAKIETVLEPEDGELMGMFQGRSAAGDTILVLDNGKARILPKSALWAMARAAELARDQMDREEELAERARENRVKRQRDRWELREAEQRKRKEDRLRAAIGGAVLAVVLACTWALIRRAGSPGVMLGILEAVLVCAVAVHVWKGRRANG